MSGPNENQPTQYLAVKNCSDKPLHAAYHGEPYDWEAGETVKLSTEAARHIFGFGLDDKTAAFHRLGWLNTRREGKMEDALARLEQIEFVPVRQLFEVSSEPLKAKGKKVKVNVSDRSLADAGVSAGEVISPEAPETDLAVGEDF
jgi:hypothetical protein